MSTSKDTLKSLGIDADAKPTFKTVKGETGPYTLLATKGQAELYGSFHIQNYPVKNPKSKAKGGIVIAAGLMFRGRIYVKGEVGAGANPFPGFETASDWVTQSEGKVDYWKIKMFFPVELAEKGSAVIMKTWTEKATPAIIQAVKDAVKVGRAKMALSDEDLKEVVEFYINQVPIAPAGCRVWKGISFKKPAKEETADE